ncbi:MAG TPA: D-2-hydroxyacid dehydrogenase, partial [Chitinophagaceae bacterium]|nr:D-2-hydroxyacid dehydrogenase [Chitinophagaceae bacterium]
VYDRTPVELIAERCRNAEVVLTNKVPFTKETMAALPQLKLISVLATGYNVIDTKAAREQGVAVSNVPGYGTASVAQHVFALLLELTNHVGLNARTTAAGKWQQSADWCYTEAPVTELAGKIFGVVGFGNIGQRAGSIAKALGMQVVYYNPRVKDSAFGLQVELKDLFSHSDFISLHCPLTATNQEFVNAALLKTMKPSAVLINTARGQLINEQDLADALNKNVIAGAALDVLSKEPPPDSNPLLKAKNCIITPHNAWISKEARGRIMAITASNIDAFLQGEPVNVVN